MIRTIYSLTYIICSHTTLLAFNCQDFFLEKRLVFKEILENSSAKNLDVQIKKSLKTLKGKINVNNKGEARNKILNAVENIKALKKTNNNDDIKAVQRAIGVIDDADVGKDTINAINGGKTNKGKVKSSGYNPAEERNNIIKDINANGNYFLDINPKTTSVHNAIRTLILSWHPNRLNYTPQYRANIFKNLLGNVIVEGEGEGKIKTKPIIDSKTKLQDLLYMTSSKELIRSAKLLRLIYNPDSNRLSIIVREINDNQKTTSLKELSSPLELIKTTEKNTIKIAYRKAFKEYYEIKKQLDTSEKEYIKNAISKKEYIKNAISKKELNSQIEAEIVAIEKVLLKEIKDNKEKLKAAQQNLNNARNNFKKEFKID